MSLKEINRIKIRRLMIVVDVEDVFAPELTIEEFREIHGTEPEPPRYRVIRLELVTCPEDNQPTLITECGKCPKFIRRYGDTVICWREI